MTRNKLLLAIDTQVDFIAPYAALPVPGADAIVGPGISFLRELDPAVYAAALFTFDTHTEAAYIGSPENLGDPEAGAPGFPIHCVKDTVGWSNVFLNPITAPIWNPPASPYLPPAIPVFTLEKGVFDMWAEDDLFVDSGRDEYDTEMFVTSDDDKISLINGTLQIERDRFFEGLKAHDVDTVTVIGVAADYCVMWAIRGLLDRGFKVEVVEHLTAGIQRDMEQTIAEEFPGQVSLIHQGTLSS
jgi:nicotinamidase/pyrazinamidase